MGIKVENHYIINPQFTSEERNSTLMQGGGEGKNKGKATLNSAKGERKGGWCLNVEGLKIRLKRKKGQTE